MTIYSPASGIVIHKHAQEGMYVKTGTKIYTIADLSQVWVQLDAYESDLIWLRYGHHVEFTTESYPGEVFKGTISFIDPILNEATRTVKVRINVPNPAMKLKPGMFADVTIVLSEDLQTDLEFDAQVKRAECQVGDAQYRHEVLERILECLTTGPQRQCATGTLAEDLIHGLLYRPQFLKSETQLKIVRGIVVHQVAQTSVIQRGVNTMAAHNIDHGRQDDAAHSVGVVVAAIDGALRIRSRLESHVAEAQCRPLPLRQVIPSTWSRTAPA